MPAAGATGVAPVAHNCAFAAVARVPAADAGRCSHMRTDQVRVEIPTRDGANQAVQFLVVDCHVIPATPALSEAIRMRSTSSMR